MLSRPLSVFQTEAASMFSLTLLKRRQDSVIAAVVGVLLRTDDREAVEDACTKVLAVSAQKSPDWKVRVLPVIAAAQVQIGDATAAQATLKAAIVAREDVKPERGENLTVA